MTQIFYREISSPIGSLTLASTEKGICAMKFGSTSKNLETLQHWWKKYDPSVTWKESNSGGWLSQGSRELNEYFSAERMCFEVPLDLQGTVFQKLVWEQLLLIPYGETMSYKNIAVNMGVPKSVRAVGGANNRNPLPIIVPCHRVIGTNKSLVGYAGGLKNKEMLLELEGALQKLS